jgi:glucans biosynthesis protein
MTRRANISRGHTGALSPDRAAAGGGPRHVLLLAATLASLAGAPDASAAFGFADVAGRAERLAKEPFQDPRGRVPDSLLKITYDQWRDIRFRPEHALWRQERLPFTVQFFHPGLFYDRPVTISVVDSAGVHHLDFSPTSFDYGKTQLGSRVPQDLGYAGFRIHYPIKTPTYHDEVIVFLGASYFRAVGQRLGFGASARGLAIDTALASGEEFPYFREFWLLRPAPQATEIEVLALLDSESLAGAYRFVVRPGEQTIVDVEARLYRRRDVARLGIAPLTSMFFFGENTLRRFDNFRPEVHDSDGLLLASDTGEWLWRPLDNPAALRESGFRLIDPLGFGLVQRDRDFDHYQDLETRPEFRPSVWIVPKGKWGAGRVGLVEIPTDMDTNDNIVAFWVPDELPPREAPVSFSYRMYWYEGDARRPPGGRTVATRRDHGPAGDGHRFVVDFAGKQLARLPADSVLRAVITVDGRADDPTLIVDQQVQKNPVTGGWRLAFQVQPQGDHPMDLRAFLQHKDEALTETWSYIIEP